MWCEAEKLLCTIHDIASVIAHSPESDCFPNPHKVRVMHKYHC
jgi:hypothetical protein